MKKKVRKRYPQKTIAKLGDHGKRVRVWREGGLVRAQCRYLRETKSYRGKDAEESAMAYARDMVRRVKGGEAKALPAEERIYTLAEVWAAYRGDAAFGELRARSKALYSEAYTTFTTVIPSTTPVSQIDWRSLGTVRSTLATVPTEKTKKPMALTSIRRVIGNMRIVLRWAEGNKMLLRNETHGWRFVIGKDNRPVPPKEYTAEEYALLIRSFNPAWARHRTPAAILAILGNQGARVNAVVHLRWEDVDWNAEVKLDDGTVLRGAVDWRAKWDKMGNDWDQPMRKWTRVMLETWWKVQGSPASGWCFPRRRKDGENDVYTGFQKALRAAEIRAGVKHLPMRSSHGFRRMVSGDVASATGDLVSAMEAIGNRDVNMAARYVQRRSTRTANALGSADIRANATTQTGTTTEEAAI